MYSWIAATDQTTTRLHEHGIIHPCNLLFLEALCYSSIIYNNHTMRALLYLSQDYWLISLVVSFLFTWSYYLRQWNYCSKINRHQLFTTTHVIMVACSFGLHLNGSPSMVLIVAPLCSVNVLDRWNIYGPIWLRQEPLPIPRDIVFQFPSSSM